MVFFLINLTLNYKNTLENFKSILSLHCFANSGFYRVGDTRTYTPVYVFVCTWKDIIFEIVVYIYIVINCCCNNPSFITIFTSLSYVDCWTKPSSLNTMG